MLKQNPLSSMLLDLQSDIVEKMEKLKVGIFVPSATSQYLLLLDKYTRKIWLHFEKWMRIT